jgi:peptidoglycan L-alanyl-D-glutamate endopeptidase CwlK
MPNLSDASKTKLATCDARLQKILNEVICHIDFFVLEGHRGEAAQNDAVRKGTSKLPWPKGNHNSTPSRAVDIAPYFASPGEKIDWKDLAAFGRLMGYVQRVAHEHNVKLRFGLDWDGDFRSRDESFLDAPHIELVDP